MLGSSLGGEENEDRPHVPDRARGGPPPEAAARSTSTESAAPSTSEAAEPFSFQLDAIGQRALRLENVNGIVRIDGRADATAVLVEGERRVASSSRSDAEDFLQRVTVEVTEVGDEIIVRTRQPAASGGREVAVDYDLTVPGGLAIDAAHVNGPVSVLDLESDVTVTLVNGSIVGCSILDRAASSTSTS